MVLWNDARFLKLFEQLAVLVLNLDQLFDFFPRICQFFDLTANRLALVVEHGLGAGEHIDRAR